MTARELINEATKRYGITRGMRRAYERYAIKRCKTCELTVPKYPGRYVSKCPACGGEIEDLQNSPVYSEGRRRRKENADRNALDAQMRRVPKDRIGRE